MTLILVPESERRIRYKEKINLNWQTNLFYAHLEGLEQFAGKRILEIGGVDPDDNVADYFMSMGSEYHTVGLEKNKAQKPYVIPVNDFRSIQAVDFYDLIISFGVFEDCGIDQSKEGDDWRSFYYSSESDLQKLFSLTRLGGTNIIGTISDPCLYSNEEIQQAGFKLEYRINGFTALNMKQRLGKSSLDESELVVMVK